MIKCVTERAMGANFEENFEPVSQYQLMPVSRVFLKADHDLFSS